MVYVYGPFDRVWAEKHPLRFSWIKEYMFIYLQTYYEMHWILRIFYRIFWISIFNTCSYGELFTGVSPLALCSKIVFLKFLLDVLGNGERRLSKRNGRDSLQWQFYKGYCRGTQTFDYCRFTVSLIFTPFCILFHFLSFLFLMNIKTLYSNGHMIKQCERSTNSIKLMRT